MMTRMQVDSLNKDKGKGKRQTRKPERKSHDQHELFRHQHVQELWQNWALSERLLETRWRSVTTIPPVNNSYTQKGKCHKKGKGKSTHVDVEEMNQPPETASTVSYPSQTPSTIWKALVQFKRGTVDHGCDNQFRVYKETSWCRVFAS